MIASSDDPKMKLAFDILVDRICHYVGAYYVSLGGKVDALVFAGGIGEQSDLLRKRVTEQAACLGFEVDADMNGKEIKEIVQDIGAKSARHKTLVCQTDEQFEMARDCAVDEKLFS
jgi:acetate kinase